MLLAVVAAASLHARVENVRLLSADSQSVIRMMFSRAPGRVAVQRDGELTRVSLERAELGLDFSGGDRFQWLREASPGRTASPCAHCPEALVIERGRGDVTLLFRLRPEVSMELRREGSAVLLVFREPSARPATTVAEAMPPSPAAVPPPPAPAQRGDSEPGGRRAFASGPPAGDTSRLPEGPEASDSRQPTVVASETVLPALATAAPASEPPAEPSEPGTSFVAAQTPPPSESGPAPTPELISQLLQTLAPAPAASSAVAATGESAATEAADLETLYYKLFPQAAPGPAPLEPEQEARGESHDERAFQLGSVAIQPTLRIAYVDAEAGLLADTATVRDRYLEIRPGFGLSTSLWQGRIRGKYEPAVRRFGGFGPTESTSHRAGVSLEIPVEGPFRLTARDAWVAGVLEAQEVDPGGEYFFDLRRFRRNTAGVATSYEVAPSWTLEAGAALNQVRLSSPGSFFDYDTRTLNLGVGHELTENLRASLAYVRDGVPRSAERPQAESTANSVQAVVAGQATPLLSAQLMLGYREQQNPFAGEGGRKYKGPVVGGSLTQMLGSVSSVTLSGTRTALLSAFEENGFYVTNQVQTATVVRLPYRLLLDGAVGYRWNDYRTVASEIGTPRADTTFDWSVGVRRPFDRWGSPGVSYQRQRRRSNIDRFDTTTDRLLLQFEFNVLSAMAFR